MKYIYSLIILVVSLSQFVVLANRSRAPIPGVKGRHTLETNAIRAEVRDINNATSFNRGMTNEVAVENQSTAAFQLKTQSSEDFLKTTFEESMAALERAVECKTNAEACEVLKAESQRLARLQKSNRNQAEVNIMSDTLINNLNRAVHSIIKFEKDARVNAASLIKDIAGHKEAGASSSKALNMAVKALLIRLKNPNPTVPEIEAKAYQIYIDCA